jgi:hypothetical protein
MAYSTNDGPHHERAPVQKVKQVKARVDRTYERFLIKYFKSWKRNSGKSSEGRSQSYNL